MIKKTNELLPGEYASAFQQFFLHKINLEGKKESSLQYYRYDICQFVRFLAENNKPVTISYGAAKEAVELFLGFLRRGDKAPKTISRQIAALKGFFKFLHVEGLIEENKWPQVRCKREHAIRPAQYASPVLREYILNVSQSLGIEKYILTYLALVTGARTSQLARLTWGTIDFDGEVLFLPLAKNGNIPVIDHAPKQFWQTLAEFRQSIPAEATYVFKGGNKDKPISINTLKKWQFQLIKACSLEAKGIDKFKWKDFRSSAATDLYDQTRDPFAVARMLGDKDYSVVQKYIQGPFEQKKRWLKTPEGQEWQMECQIIPEIKPEEGNEKTKVHKHEHEYIIKEINELIRNYKEGYLTEVEFLVIKKLVLAK